VQRTGYADFWELYKRNVLPGETRNYVPIILAMTIMAKNPSQYGLDHLVLDRPTAFDTVRIHYPVDLRLVAECTDSSAATLQELNPSLLRMTTPKDMDFDLRLPAGTAEHFQSTIAAIPEEMRVYWRYHRVQSGETLAEIARRYRTTASAISEANNLDGTELKRDARLIIPVAPAKAVNESSTRAAAQTYSKHPARYTTRKGDTVLSVADDFGVPAEKVRQWNHLSGNALHAGRSLTIFKPATAAAPAAANHGRTRTPAAHGKTHGVASATTKARNTKPSVNAKPAAKPHGKAVPAKGRKAPGARKAVARTVRKAAPTRRATHKQRG
jgi:membrane-bound lytic murein transglycosylase D